MKQNICEENFYNILIINERLIFTNFYKDLIINGPKLPTLVRSVADVVLLTLVSTQMIFSVVLWPPTKLS